MNRPEMRYEAETSGHNFYALDANLHSALRRVMPEEWARWEATLSAFGAWAGDTVDAAAAYTDGRGRPALEPYDRDGNPVNRIRTNPAWDAVSREVYQRGAVGLNYGADAAPFTLTFIMGYLLSQADVSLHCPVAMTGAMAYVLDRFAPEKVKAAYLPMLVRTDGGASSGGTWATEQSGGSDLGATTTTASEAGDHMLPLEAGLGLALEAARAFDAHHADPGVDPSWLRLLIALAKYRTGEDANVACRTAIEVMGGNAYTDDYVTPRLLRDAQVMTVWEGPANIQALEVMRILGGEGSAMADFRGRVGEVLAAAPEALGDVAAAIAKACGECDEAAARLAGRPERVRRHARKLTDLMADTLAAALLLEEATYGHAHGDGRKAAVAPIFLAARLEPPPRRGIVPAEDEPRLPFDALARYEALDIEPPRDTVADSLAG